MHRIAELSERKAIAWAGSQALGWDRFEPRGGNFKQSWRSELEECGVNSCSFRICFSIIPNLWVVAEAEKSGIPQGPRRDKSQDRPSFVDRFHERSTH